MINKTIDNYKIIEEIGRGGMGVVYKAEDLTLEKVVALKMVDPLLASDERFLKRFRGEAKALASLEDPNIITVHAFRETPDGVFMVMRYMEGTTIAEMIAENGPLPYREVVAIAKQILSGLSHAHAAGVIHRDIKPTNIMIGHDGVVKVMDFGLAKMQRGPESTITNRGIGTLKYMSPEQVERPDSLDHRTDIYSVGMTLYEMLAGETPFSDTSTTDFSIMKAIVEKEFAVPTQRNTNVPRQLGKIVMKALEKQPEARYQSADEVTRDLKKFERFDRLNLLSRTSTFIKEQKAQPVRTSRDAHHRPPATPPSSGFAPAFAKLRAYKAPLAASAAALLFLTLLFTLLGGRQEVPLQQEPDKPAPAPVGHLLLDVTPATTEITINGQPVGTAEQASLSLAPGSYNFLLSLVGHRSESRTVEITVGQSVTLKHHMEPVSTLTVIVDPAGALVMVDGQRIATPEEPFELEPGPHNLQVSKVGYEPVVRDFTLRQGGSDTITLSLNKKSTPVEWTNLRINSEPQGAEVFIDGRFLGTTPMTAIRLKNGRHAILLEKKGFASHSGYANLPGRRTYFAQLVSKPKVTVKLRAVDAEGKRVKASIRIDGQETGISTPYALEIPIETQYAIEASKTGYLSVRESLKFTKDITLEFVMRPVDLTTKN